MTMRYTNNLLLSAVLIVGACLSASGGGGRPGELLRWGVSARALGMGKAFTAVSDGASAAYWNPAALIHADSQEAEMLHSQLWEDTVYDAVSYVHPSISRRGFGVSLVRIGSGNFEKRDAENSLASTFGVAETALSLAYGQLLTRNVSIGAAVNYLNRSVDSYSNSLFAIDVSGRYRVLPGTDLGVRAGNVLGFAGGDTEDKLPMSLRVGAVRRFFDGRFLAALDLELPGQWYIGFETQLNPVMLRFGLNYEEMTAGAGVAYRTYRFDYALSQHALGLSHRLSFGYRFGQDRSRQRTKKAEDLLRKADQLCSKGQYLKAVTLFEQGLGLETTAETEKKYQRLRNITEKVGLKEVADNKGSDRERLTAEMLNRAIEQYLNNNLVNAAKKVQQIINITPDDQRARALEEMFRKEGLPQNTEEMSGEALIAVKLHRAVNYFHEGKYDLAIKECNEVIDLDPRNALAHERLGSAYYAVGMKEKAVEEWKKAFELDPANRELQEFLKNAGGK